MTEPDPDAHTSCVVAATWDDYPLNWTLRERRMGVAAALGDDLDGDLEPRLSAMWSGVACSQDFLRREP